MAADILRGGWIIALVGAFTALSHHCAGGDPLAGAERMHDDGAVPPAPTPRREGMRP